jgi:hypothetical protein
MGSDKRVTSNVRQKCKFKSPLLLFSLYDIAGSNKWVTSNANREVIGSNPIVVRHSSAGRALNVPT